MNHLVYLNPDGHERIMQKSRLENGKDRREIRTLRGTFASATYGGDRP